MLAIELSTSQPSTAFRAATGNDVESPSEITHPHGTLFLDLLLDRHRSGCQYLSRSTRVAIGKSTDPAIAHSHIGTLSHRPAHPSRP